MLFHQAGPVLVGLGHVAIEILIEGLQDRLVQVEIQLLIANLPGIDNIHRKQGVDGYPEGTETAALGDILRGRGFEQFLVLLGCENIGRALVGGGNPRVAIDGLLVGEEGHGIEATDRDAARPSGINEFCGVSRDGEQRDGCHGFNDVFHVIYCFVFVVDSTANWKVLITELLRAGLAPHRLDFVSRRNRFGEIGHRFRHLIDIVRQNIEPHIRDRFDDLAVG